ncbi:RHS repeat-associated core domain-containing protein [[Flexibacter] sp. ATCC 35103]|uniref:RHS repeat-associated core domain-containing protein n=1 Tax=[Flexibacter] sp. ATCC 35103 TaxID=1937528 RepID=UPI0009D065AA|nr:RHS repeat-associated core domain-containing protein [[Flexibacter] sp. ATCC 35103]OMQ13494.1 type IV secretion protein Rhs [[Flexibacter] sp. ATCC 35103]
MLLTDNHLTMVVGIDIHFTTLPPFNPFHPYIGIVIDPADYIPFLGTSVHVNGFKRGNSDTGGIIIPLVHIPLFTPPWLMTPIIGHESMNFFASQTVFSDSTRMSPKGHMLMTCNDIGIPLSMSIGKTKIGKKMLPFAPTLFAPTSFSLPIPTGKPVMVGGPYPPDWGGMLTGLLASIGFSTLMKYGKKAFNKLLKGSVGPNWLSKLLCKAGFEPVNLINGAVIYEGSDFDIASPITLNWERRWYSDSQYVGWLGHGVHCVYDRAVELYPEDDALGLRMDDGRIVAFPALMPEEEFYLRQEKTTLKRTEDGYQAYDHKSRLFYDFTLFNGKKYQLTKISNHDGISIVFKFTGYTLNSIIDAAGRTIMVNTKDGFIHNLELVGPEQNELLIMYHYDENQNMTAIIDALGKPTVIEYQNHLMVKKTDRNGQAFYWEYDSENRCVHTWGDGGWQEGWIEYHTYEGYNLVTDANGAVTTYYYEPSQLVTQVKDPMGNSVFYDYTEFMELYREIDQEGRILGFNYDDKGNKISTTYPDGNEEMMLYDDENRPSIAIDPEGHKTIYLYKDQKPHQLKTIIAPDKTSTHFTYYANGLLASVAKNKNELELVYDQQYNLIEWRENDQKLKSWDYDYRGRVKAVYTPMQMADYFSYDALDRVQQIIEKDSNIIEFDYDNYDDVIALKDNKNNIKFTYTPLGSLSTREQNGVKVRFDYDKMEQLVGIKNEYHEAYYFTRNKAGHIIRETAFDGIVKKYNRNLAGEVTRIDHGGGKYTDYEQDALGRITRADYHDGTWEIYTYNKNGQLVEATNQNVSIYLERDAVGRIIKETQKQQLDANENGITLISTYNTLGQRTNISTSLGADINTHFNQKGQLERIEAQSNELKEQHKAWETTLKRDELGREIERFATGGLHIKTSYNNNGKQKEQEVFANGKRTGSRYYNWDTNQQLRSAVNQMTQSLTYFDYDDFGNLAKASYDGKEDLYKTPDAVGNLYKTADRSDRKYGKGGKLLKDEKYYYKYDDLGNLVHKSPRDITKPLVFEKPTNFFDKLIGNKAEEKSLQYEHEQWQQGDTAYSWLANGMLKSVTNPDGKKVRFEYDALGRRTAKIANKEIFRYFWDANVLIHEWKYDLKERPKLVVDGDHLIYDKPELIDNLITWVYEGGSFVPSAKIIGEYKFSIVNDYIGRPIQVYNEVGDVVWETDYDIYGGLRELKGDKSFIPFRQLGQYEDVETSLYYNRFRYYSADIGLYISQDPIGIAGNNPNIYAYVKDTNNWIDIFGLNNISTGEGRSHVKYSGVKDGKPYHGYASAPTSDGLTPDQIVSRRYGGNFDDFDVAPSVDYSGEGKKGKQTARGLEQRGFEADGGLKGTSNAQNPVGPNNANRQKYLDAADEHLGTKIKCH